MQREAWQSMPIGYESESNRKADVSVSALDIAVGAFTASRGGGSPERWKRKSSLKRQQWR